MAVLPLGFVFSANFPPMSFWRVVWRCSSWKKKKRACTDSCVRGLEENTIQMRKQSTQTILSDKTYWDHRSKFYFSSKLQVQMLKVNVSMFCLQCHNCFSFCCWESGVTQPNGGSNRLSHKWCIVAVCWELDLTVFLWNHVLDLGGIPRHGTEWNRNIIMAVKPNSMLCSKFLSSKMSLNSGLKTELGPADSPYFRVQISLE